MRDGVIRRRILRDRREDRTFGKSKLGNILAEISYGSSLDTKRILSEIDRIQIILQNFGFAHGLLKLDGEILFLDFPFHLRLERIFIDEIRVDGILDQLLCDRTGTFRKMSSVCDALHDSAGDTLQIDAVMFIKAGILDRDKSILCIGRDLVDAAPYTVGVGRHEPFQFRAVLIDYKCSVAAWLHISGRNGRSVSNHAADDPITNDTRADEADDNGEYDDAKYGDLGFALMLILAGSQVLLLLRSALFTIVHCVLPPYLTNYNKDT